MDRKSSLNSPLLSSPLSILSILSRKQVIQKFIATFRRLTELFAPFVEISSH